MTIIKTIIRNTIESAPASTTRFSFAEGAILEAAINSGLDRLVAFREIERLVADGTLTKQVVGRRSYLSVNLARF